MVVARTVLERVIVLGRKMSCRFPEVSSGSFQFHNMTMSCRYMSVSLSLISVVVVLVAGDREMVDQYLRAVDYAELHRKRYCCGDSNSNLRIYASML